MELKRWEKTVETRKWLLQSLLKVMGDDSIEEFPRSYRDESRDIVPLRLAWAPQKGQELRAKLNRFLQTSWTWFMHPIVATPEPLERFGYQIGSCPVSEKLGPRMVNLPCNLSRSQGTSLIEILRKDIS